MYKLSAIGNRISRNHSNLPVSKAVFPHQPFYHGADISSLLCRSLSLAQPDIRLFPCPYLSRIPVQILFQKIQAFAVFKPPARTPVTADFLFYFHMMAVCQLL